MNWYNKYATSKKMPTVQLGKTNLNASMLGLGAMGAIGRKDLKKEAEEILNSLKKFGINYIDTAHVYGNGLSEKRLGEFLQGQRNDFIVATKTDTRDYDAAKKQIETSLKRLKTDHVDILQVHCIENMADVKRARNNTFKAIREAQEEGLTKYVGITGHGHPEALTRAINEFDADMVLVALNAADVHHKSFIEEALPAAVNKGMGVVAMKIFGYGNIFTPEGITTPSQAINYVYSLPIDISVVGVDNLAQLEENVKAVKSFKKLDKRQMKKLEDITENYYKVVLFYKGGLEKYNTYWW